MIIRIFFILALVLSYGFVFTHNYAKTSRHANTLDLALPVNFYRVAAGYMQQLAAEMLFIRTGVFLGGLPPGTPPASYEQALTNNFEVMTSLYPPFIDPYYFCHGFLSPISPEAAANANRIFETGIAAHPDNFFLLMFQGTNYSLSMNDPLKGAKVFGDAAKIPDAPPLFAHLAALLSAQGGDITAGIVSLRALVATEINEVVRERYEEELRMFESALAVQGAVNDYVREKGVGPPKLEMLVPDYLSELPDFGDQFVLVYDPPVVHLRRPTRKNMKSAL